MEFKFNRFKLNIELMALVGLLMTLNIVSAQTLTADQIFSINRVLDVQITVNPEDWATICSQGRDFNTISDPKRKDSPLENPFTYVEAEVTIDGVILPRVGIRKKGFLGSLSRTRPSLKVKLNYLNQKGEIDGITNLTFNNNQQDSSLMSQFMSYTLFNAVGLPAPRCAYAQVAVNGQNLGIYSHVERVHKPFLKRAFGNDNGALYEGTLIDFRPGWVNGFEHKLGSDEVGRQKIQQLIEVLEGEDKNIEEAIGQLVDLDSFYIFWVMEGLLGLWDGYSGNENNFFFYLNPETGKFHFIPWGADHGFSRFHGKRQYDEPPPISVKTQGLIAYRLYQIEACRQRYERTLREILTKHWQEDDLLAEIERLEALLQPYTISDQKIVTQGKTFGKNKKRIKGKDFSQGKKLSKGKEFGANKDLAKGSRRSIGDFIRYRREEINNEITNGMPIWMAPPKSLLAKGKKRSPSDGTDLKGKGKKGDRNITQQQAEGWINYFHTASEQQIHQAIQSQKFQTLDSKVQREILNRAEEFKLNLVAEKIKKFLEK